MQFRAQKLISATFSLSNLSKNKNLLRSYGLNNPLQNSSKISNKFIFQAQRTFFSKFRNQGEQKTQPNQTEDKQENKSKQEEVQNNQQKTEDTKQQTDQKDESEKLKEAQEKVKEAQQKAKEVQDKAKKQAERTSQLQRASIEEILKNVTPIKAQDFELPEGVFKEGGELYLKEAINRLEQYHKELKQTQEKLRKTNEEHELLKKVNEDVHKQMNGLKERALAAIDEAAQTRIRIEKEKQQMKLYAVSELAKDILETVDNLVSNLSIGRALQASKDRAGKNDNLYDGVLATEKILLKTLEKYGVVQVNPLKEKFDPNQHEALMQFDDPTIPGGHVGLVLQVGYKIADRNLRPAKVGVVNERPDEKQSKKE